MSERDLAARLGASRTTVRKCRLSPLEMPVFWHPTTIAPAVADSGRFLSRGRNHHGGHYWSSANSCAWILQSDSRPGQAINTARLAREFGTSTTTIREFLQSFQHFGLLERQPGGGWVFRGMTLEFANELSDIREIFELRSVLKFVANPG